MLRRCVALGTDWLWLLQHTHDFSCEWPRHLAHSAAEKKPVSPGTATCCRPRFYAAYTQGCRYCDRLLHFFFFEWLLPLWSVQLMSETLAQAVSERFSGNVQTGRGNLDWGTARSAAADAVPEQQEQQQRRHGCDAKACQKKQRFKSRKGKVSSMHSTLCSFPAASNCILKLIWL